jgi:hypothetical protein
MQLKTRCVETVIMKCDDCGFEEEASDYPTLRKAGWRIHRIVEPHASGSFHDWGGDCYDLSLCAKCFERVSNLFVNRDE